jgi:hypothetical protein
MQGKSLVALAQEFVKAFAKADMPICQLNWTMVSSEEAKARYIEARIDEGYDCQCEVGGPEECLAATTIVVDAEVGADEETVEAWQRENDEAGLDADASKWAEAEPIVIVLSRGDAAVAVGSSPITLIAALSAGSNPAEANHATFEERLERAEVAVVSDVDEFLRGLGMSDETTSDEAGQ